MTSMYPKLLESKKFRLRAEADAWGKKKKEEYKLAEMVVKTDIKFNEGTKEWTVLLYLKMEQ